MKIAVFGALPFSDLIKDGLNKLGHEITNNNPDLIFANDPTAYQDAVFLKDKHPKVQLILNVLDIPWHFPNVEQQFNVLIKRFFYKAENITTISYKVKKDLSNFFDKNTNDEIQVIYNPIQDISYDKKIKKDNQFLYVGRANDPIKRFNLVKESLQKIKESEKNIKICGSENPGYGNYLGYVSNKDLNYLYNSSKYLFLTSKAEGIGLSMIEGMICGSVPIVCSDNETAKEFIPLDFICDPNVQSIVSKIEENNNDYEKKRELSLKFGKKYKEKFNKINIAKNILNLKKDNRNL